MEILKITEGSDGGKATIEAVFEEEEIVSLLEIAVNHILKEAIEEHEKKFEDLESPSPPSPPPKRIIDEGFHDVGCNFFK